MVRVYPKMHRVVCQTRLMLLVNAEDLVEILELLKGKQA